MELDTSKMWCSTCGHRGLLDGDDGFYYCEQCGTQADDFQDTGVADEDFVDKGAEPGGGGGGGIYAASLRRSQFSQPVVKAEPLSQVPWENELWNKLTQEGKSEGNNGSCNLCKGDECDWADFDWGRGAGTGEFGDAKNKAGLDYEDYYNKIRLWYVTGLQLMVQLQCEALVKDFGVSPVVCGLAGSIWLRFVSKSGVFDDEWADQAVADAENMHEGEAAQCKTRPKYRDEPHTLYGRRALLVWLRSLKKTIPIHCTLAVSFLVCHIAREAILPADIVKWSLEGKLPYFGAYVKIQKHIENNLKKHIGKLSRACPIRMNSMLRPIQSVPVLVLEVLAARIAESIDLHLPPVNFYAIARRYLKKLSIPSEEVLPHACHICEWSMPPELWLSRNEHRLPTCLYVMSIIIVTIRTLYNIHGFGYWEKSLSNNPSISSEPDMDTPCKSKLEASPEESSEFPPLRFHHPDAGDSGNLSHIKKSKLDAQRLLNTLEVRYHELVDMKEYSMDSPAFFQYCNDLAFAGVELPNEDHEEVNLVKQLWDVYRHNQDCNSSGQTERPLGGHSGQKRFRDDGLDRDEHVQRSSKNNRRSMEEKRHSGSSLDDRLSSDSLSAPDYNQDSSYSSQGDSGSGSIDQTSTDSFIDAAIRKIKLNMEENRFTYIPPRVNVKRFDYLHYVRKRDDGALTYVAHADYFILLRACAKAAQVDVRVMHVAVLSFERRLAWMEQRVNYCLHLRPLNVSCQNCGDIGHEDLGLEDLVLEDLRHEDFGHEDLRHEDLGHKDLRHEDLGHEDVKDSSVAFSRLNL